MLLILSQSINAISVVYGCLSHQLALWPPPKNPLTSTIICTFSTKVPLPWLNILLREKYSARYQLPACIQNENLIRNKISTSTYSMKSSLKNFFSSQIMGENAYKGIKVLQGTYYDMILLSTPSNIRRIILKIKSEIKVRISE